MKDKPKNLSIFLTISCLIIASLPLILYFLLAFWVFGSGLDTIHESNLIKAIFRYNYNKSNHNPNISLGNTYVTQNLDDLPIELRNTLPQKLKNDTLYHKVIKSYEGKIEKIYFFIVTTVNKNKYFAYEVIPEEESNKYIKPQALNILYILILSFFISLFFLYIFINKLIKRVLQPLKLLSNWVNSISYENIDIIPNFSYNELNEIGKYIQKNLKNEYDFLKSEEQFWNFCSHELRTPITVLKVGIDLLTKKTEFCKFDKEKFLNTLERMRESSHSIANLIETILWINRPNIDITYQKFDLSIVLKEIIYDFTQAYFIQPDRVHITTHSYYLYQPIFAVRIVLENVIRNAIQHSNGEDINIIQVKNNVKVINKWVPRDVNVKRGFGLGYEIISRLINKLNWHIKILTNETYNIVSIYFS